jgi:hypothetical protein
MFTLLCDLPSKILLTHACLPLRRQARMDRMEASAWSELQRGLQIRLPRVERPAQIMQHAV